MLCFIGSGIAGGCEISSPGHVQMAMMDDGADDVLDGQNVGQIRYDNVLDAMFHAPDLETMLACGDEISGVPSLSADARHTVQLIELFTELRHHAQGGIADHVGGKGYMLLELWHNILC